MLVADLTQYAVHRTFHRVGWLWPFHAIHHSSRTLDWLAGSRLHVVDIIVTRALILVPLFALGFSQTALYIWLVIVAVQATLNHVNIRFDVPILNQLVVLPRFHHWHHAMKPADKNFAVHFPWIDRLFGTYHMPKGEWPPETGIENDRVPAEFLDSSSGRFDAAPTDRTGLSIDGLERRNKSGERLCCRGSRRNE